MKISEFLPWSFISGYESFFSLSFLRSCLFKFQSVLFPPPLSGLISCSCFKLFELLLKVFNRCFEIVYFLVILLNFGLKFGTSLVLSSTQSFRISETLVLSTRVKRSLISILSKNIDVTILVFAVKFFSITLSLDMLQKLIRWTRLKRRAIERTFLYHQVVQMLLPVLKLKYSLTWFYFAFEPKLILNFNQKPRFCASNKLLLAKRTICTFTFRDAALTKYVLALIAHRQIFNNAKANTANIFFSSLLVFLYSVFRRIFQLRHCFFFSIFNLFFYFLDKVSGPFFGLLMWQKRKLMK